MVKRTDLDNFFCILVSGYKDFWRLNPTPNLPDWNQMGVEHTN